MFRLFEQNRLGSHDLILLGTVCNIDAVTRHPDYRRFVTLGMSAFVAAPGEDHRRFVEAQKTAEDKVTALSLFTLLAHENRHFWDMITTTSGLRLIGRALEIQCEYITRCAGLPFRGPVCFPFSEWVRDREALGALQPELASPPEEVVAFASSAQRFEQDKQAWETGGAGPDGSPSSTQILEGLAVLAQAESIEHGFGKPARTLYEGMLRTGEAGRWYLGAIDYVRHRLPELDNDGVGLLLQMSLYGSVERSWAESSPAALLRYLVDSFDGTRPQFPTSFTEQYVLCDGWLTLRQGIGPHPSFGMAGKALFKRVNEIGAGIQAGDGGAAMPAPVQSVVTELLDYVATVVNIGARVVQKVLFAGTVSNLRFTHQGHAAYRIPRAAPFFESSQGLILAGNLSALVRPLLGATLAPGAKAALANQPGNDFAALLRPVPDDQPVQLLNLFAPVGQQVPKHAQQAWNLFPHMLMCRMAVVGPFETHALAAVLQSQFLSAGGYPVYSHGRRIAPMDDAPAQSS